MTAFYGKRDRKVIPRWRSSKQSAATPEARPLGSHLPAVSQAGDLLDSLTADWRSTPGIFVASDLIGAAFTVSKLDLPAAQEAARFLVKAGAKAPDAARRLAKEFLAPKTVANPDFSETPAPPVHEIVREAIRSLKARVQRDPRNA